MQFVRQLHRRLPGEDSAASPTISVPAGASFSEFVAAAKAVGDAVGGGGVETALAVSAGGGDGAEAAAGVAAVFGL